MHVHVLCVAHDMTVVFLDLLGRACVCVLVSIFVLEKVCSQVLNGIWRPVIKEKVLKDWSIACVLFINEYVILKSCLSLASTAMASRRMGTTVWSR